MELKAIEVRKPADVNVIIGQAHFIKTVEDLYEALVQAVPEHQVRRGVLRGLGAVPDPPYGHASRNSSNRRSSARRRSPPAICSW